MAEDKKLEEKEKEKTNDNPKSKNKMAVILLRGLININQDVKDTLFLLRLRKKHACVILENNASNMGMIKKIKDYVTYGEIDDKTLKELISKRGKEDPNNKGKTKPFFELAPPKGGFERKGIKKTFKQGGALGFRGDKINDLIRKMM